MSLNEVYEFQIRKSPAFAGLFSDGEVGSGSNRPVAIFGSSTQRQSRCPKRMRFVEASVRARDPTETQIQKTPHKAGFFVSGGEGGIRTLDTGLGYTPLAGERLQPLGHLTNGAASYHKKTALKGLKSGRFRPS